MHLDCDRPLAVGQSGIVIGIKIELLINQPFIRGRNGSEVGGEIQAGYQQSTVVGEGHVICPDRHIVDMHHRAIVAQQAQAEVLKLSRVDDVEFLFELNRAIPRRGRSHVHH